MSNLRQKSFKESKQFQQFQQIPCVTIQQTNIQQHQLQNHSQKKEDSQQNQYIQYLRQKGQQQLKQYTKFLIIKTVCFGIMIGLLILTVIYDKLFFSTHYYQHTRQYQWGQFGYDLTRIQNLPNNQFGIIPQFTIQSSEGHNNWDPQHHGNDNSYHEINDQTKKDKYGFNGYIMQQQMLKDLKSQDQITQYQFAIHLLELTHNINYKGQLKVQATKYQKLDQDLKKKQQRLKKLLQYQKNKYQKKYNISQYIKHQLPFCIVIPSYNNVQNRLYLRNLDSIFMQDYNNYHIVYIDDASPDKTGQFVNKYIQQRQIPKSKIQVIINQENILALGNLYKGITNYCKSGQIVMLLDGDDAFMGTQVMSLFNAVYQQNKAGVAYSRYLVITDNDRGGIGGSSRQIPADFLTNGKFRQLRGFFTSHLLTFYADLFWKVQKQDLTYQNGTFFKFAYDVALITPIIEMIGERVKFIPETNYQYRYDTGINDPGWGQIEVNDIVFSKPKYSKLDQFPFIDNFYENLEKQ